MLLPHEIIRFKTRCKALTEEQLCFIADGITHNTLSEGKSLPLPWQYFFVV